MFDNFATIKMVSSLEHKKKKKYGSVSSRFYWNCFTNQHVTRNVCRFLRRFLNRCGFCSDRPWEETFDPHLRFIPFFNRYHFSSLFLHFPHCTFTLHISSSSQSVEAFSLSLCCTPKLAIWVYWKCVWLFGIGFSVYYLIVISIDLYKLCHFLSLSCWLLCLLQMNCLILLFNEMKLGFLSFWIWIILNRLLVPWKFP